MLPPMGQSCKKNCTVTFESLTKADLLWSSCPPPAPPPQYMVRTSLVATLARQLHVCQLETEANQLAEDFANVIRDIGDVRKTGTERGGPTWSEVCRSLLCLP